MAIEESDFQFLAKREKFIKAWPWLGGALVVLMLGYGAYLLVAQPLLINPVFVVEQLTQDKVSPEILRLMAGMLPEVVIMCFVLAGALLAFSFTVMATERRYLRIIAEQNTGKTNADPSA